MTDDAERRYLTIVRWPDGWERDDVAMLLGNIGLDEATARVRLRTPPAIFALLPAETALRGIMALQEKGGDAFTCSLEDLEALGPTLKVKDLGLDAGQLSITLWRGPDLQVDPRRLEVIVRATLSDEVGMDPGRLPQRTDYDVRDTALFWGIGGAYGMAARLHARAELRDLATLDRRVTVSHKLDLHVDDGRVLQIDGDKFGFRVLGAMRGHSDNVNIDRMCELMTHLAPEVVVDPYFELWRPPPGFDRLRLPMMQVNQDDPAFAFYSRWAALMYRHVLG